VLRCDAREGVLGAEGWPKPTSGSSKDTSKDACKTRNPNWQQVPELLYVHDVWSKGQREEWMHLDHMGQLSLPSMPRLYQPRFKLDSAASMLGLFFPVELW
jgi:hypothetical protein